MAAPVVLHVTRPYDSEEEYLAAEAWTIDAAGMLLVGQKSYAPDTTIVFDVSLANGKKVLRAEGRVVNHLPASDDRPGGLRVRFRRFAAQTKAFIDRAVAARGQRLASGVSSHPPPSARAPASVRPPRQKAPSIVPARSPAPEARAASAALVGSTQERSGIHSRPGTPVAAPHNREELLLRLRERRREAEAQGTAQGIGRGVGTG
jgi:hypothetical protein